MKDEESSFCIFTFCEVNISELFIFINRLVYISVFINVAGLLFDNSSPYNIFNC